MARTDNYLKQAAQAKAYFLTYDQEALIRKLNLAHDEDYLYPVFFSQTYRLSRKTGDLARQGKHGWEDANTHGEVMTLLDLICDSREDRFVSGKWKDMAQFGHTFHQNLLEERDPLAEACQDVLHEPCRRKLIKDYDSVRASAKAAGAPAFFISGSGSTMIALTKSETVAERFIELVRARHPNFASHVLHAASDGVRVETK